MTEHLPLHDAVARHVHAGDALHPLVGHTRWTAALNEVIRQWWGRDPGFTLIMASLSTLGAMFFRGGLVRHVVTGYSGDSLPTFSPNPWFRRGYESGDVTVEHWSFLAFAQRLEAGARGLPAIVTRSIADSSMEENDAFARVDTPFGTVGMLGPLIPDVALLHAPVADRAGNVALAPPLLEGVWGAFAARRGAIVTVERVVDDLRPLSHLVRIPAHRVLAVCDVPFGAHPGGLVTGPLPATPYGEDYDFWIEARTVCRGNGYDDWIRRWVLDCPTPEEYRRRLGPARLDALVAKAAPAPASASPESPAASPGSLAPSGSATPEPAPANAWERATVWAARHVAGRLADPGFDAVLAGAGVANLAAWLGVALARAAGHGAALTSEIGMWDYTPTLGDPLVLNHRNFPTARALSDASDILGTAVAGPGTRVLGCLGATQVDRAGNLNSTLIPDGAFLVGSGGGNDVASTADEIVVVATLTPARTPEVCGYVTSPGRAVTTVVTDLGVLARADAREPLRLVAVPAGDGTLTGRVAAARAACGWPLELAGPPEAVAELAPPNAEELAALRAWDPQAWFLRG